MSKQQNNNVINGEISLWPALFFCLIQFCTVTDNSALMNASSAIAITFKANVADLQAANIMYPLMAGAIMVAAGFLGKIFGWKHLMQCGLAVLTAGELISVISPNIITFVYCARVLVGIGASLSIPAVLGLITMMYKKKQQAVVFGMLAATIALASAISPVISGFIIVYVNWQTVFIILIALFSCSLVYISLSIENDRVSDTKITFDFVGFILLFAGLCILITGLMGIVKWGLINPIKVPFTFFGYSPSLPFIFAGIIIIVFLIKHEYKLERKKGISTVLIPRTFIKNRQTISSISMSAFIYLILGGSVFLIFIFLQIFFNASAISTGYVMMVFALGMVPLSILTPHYGGNFSPRAICILGIIVSFIGCLGIGFGISAIHGIETLFYIGIFVMGIGSGLVASQSNFIAGTSIKDKRLASQSSGLQGAMRNIGQAISIAVISAIFLIAFTVNVKNNISNSKLNSEFKQKIISLKIIPTNNRNTVIKILKTKYSLSRSDIKVFLDLYWSSSVDAFRLANIILGIILLLFLIPALYISGEKLKTLQKQNE